MLEERIAVGAVRLAELRVTISPLGGRRDRLRPLWPGVRVDCALLIAGPPFAVWCAAEPDVDPSGRPYRYSSRRRRLESAFGLFREPNGRPGRMKMRSTSRRASRAQFCWRRGGVRAKRRYQSAIGATFLSDGRSSWAAIARCHDRDIVPIHSAPIGGSEMPGDLHASRSPNEECEPAGLGR